MRQKAEQKGLNLKIDSAGTESMHAGEHPDRRAQKIARAKGIDISGLVARQIKSQDFDKFDMILVADAQVYREVMDIARNENDKKKVDFIMNLVQPGSNTGVPDPYYGGQDGFEKVYAMLDKACDSIILMCQG